MDISSLYEQYRLQNRRLRSQTTHSHYLIAIRHLENALGKRPTTDDLNDISLVRLEKHLADLSAFTVNGYIANIKALWRYACRVGLCQQWPTLQRLETDEPDKPTWTVEEVRRLMAIAGSQKRSYCGVPRGLWWTSLLRTLWDTGERIGALRSCTWSMLHGNILSIPGRHRKGHKPATYMLTPEALRLIEQSRASCQRQLIWPWELCEASFYNHFSRILRQARLPADRKSKAQRFRRTHLTLWELAGKDATTRAQHTSRAVTERFYIDATRLPQVDPGTVLPKL